MIQEIIPTSRTTPGPPSQSAMRLPRVRFVHEEEANYGRALKGGILDARGDLVVCDEIDLCDTEFYRRARQILDPDRADMVVGSKVMQGAQDRRPMMRHRR